MELDRVKLSQDSGVSSVESESDTSPADMAEKSTESEESKTESELQLTSVDSTITMTAKLGDNVEEAEPPSVQNCRKFEVNYLGSLILDRRYTHPMLPWVMAEVKHRNDCQPIKLEVLTFTLKGFRMDGNNVLFEHKLQSLSRFARTQADPTCFAYSTKTSAAANHSVCHVFQAVEEAQVPELFKAIREATKEAGKEQCPSNLKEGKVVENMGDLMKAGHSFFEVLYTGKVAVSQKKAPSTFIDESVDKFLNTIAESDGVSERTRHSSGTSVRSLPMTLEGNVSIMENELKKCNGDSDKSVNSNKSSDTLSSHSGDNIDSANSTDKESSTEQLEPIRRKLSDDLKISKLRINTTNKDKDSNDNTKNPGSLDGGRLPVQKDSENLMKDTLNKCLLPSNLSDNRVMLLQIGNDEVCLISTDQKTVMLNRGFKDISFCSQGTRHPEHFGFISREPGPAANSFNCYVFQCATEGVVEEIMQALKQAFNAAFNKCAKNHVVCVLCPMHQLNKLCQEIEGVPAIKATEVIQKRVDALSEQDQSIINAMVKSENPMTAQDMNEVLMKGLRIACENQQSEHVHLSDSKRLQKNEFNLNEATRKVSASSRLDKVKRSLTNSFENLIKRKSSREEMDTQEVRERSNSAADVLTYLTDSSASNTPEQSPCPSPIKKEFSDRLPWLSRREEQPPLRRARSSTVDSTGDSNRHRKVSLPPRVADLRNHNTEQRVPSKGMPKLSPRQSALEGASITLQTSPRHQQLEKSPSDGYATSPKTPLKRRGSWRQAIFISVVTPAHTPKNAPIEESPETIPENYEYDSSTSSSSFKESPRSHFKFVKRDYKEMWKKAILETLLLIRMEKENKHLQARQDEMETKRMKLDYEEITPCLKDVTTVWDGMIHTPNRINIKFDSNKLLDAVKHGVPRSRRGDVWILLVEQHCHNYPGLGDPNLDSNVPYERLLKQLTTHQHAILIDLGRTFPTHPYFNTQLGAGQLALFNLLKAYSLLDKEVGYCQGLSFVAGVLLMHMQEDNAFVVLKYLMFKMGLRRQYRPDMVALQIQMYQLSRLLHDNYRDLYEHFEANEIAPTLYAAPWFLTLFASQYPLGFVARVFDLLFLQGMEVIFKVALVLLGNHKELLMQCDSFETIVEFLKTTLPSLGIIQMERVINQVFQLDISKQLQAYEVEYHVLQEEMITSPQRGENDQIQKLEGANRNLKRQNMELLEQLQAAHGTQHSLQLNTNNMQANVNKLKSHIRTLEIERAALLQTVSKLRELVPEEKIEDADIDIPKVAPAVTFTGSPIHNPLVSRVSSDESGLEPVSTRRRKGVGNSPDREVAHHNKPGPRFNIDNQPPRPMSN
ncbi:TBC1 domain family member 1-like isoform X2 [Lineus longissimus]|uniref:TBC1 domain family member 1-like isoform X2 n=1 Tax=Lineus longissimus TaxID=88925 RepID=UPI002B4ECC67